MKNRFLAALDIPAFDPACIAQLVQVAPASLTKEQSCSFASVRSNAASLVQTPGASFAKISILHIVSAYKNCKNNVELYNKNAILLQTKSLLQFIKSLETSKFEISAYRYGILIDEAGFHVDIKPFLR